MFGESVEKAQTQIFNLMKLDSFMRFIENEVSMIIIIIIIII